jgi:hypothetical protein
MQSENRRGMRKVIPMEDVNNAKDPEYHFCYPGSFLSEVIDYSIISLVDFPFTLTE